MFFSVCSVDAACCMERELARAFRTVRMSTDDAKQRHQSFVVHDDVACFQHAMAWCPLVLAFVHLQLGFLQQDVGHVGVWWWLMFALATLFFMTHPGMLQHAVPAR